MHGAFSGGRVLEGHFLVSFILFLAAGLTDALDGLLARWLKQRSMLGHYLDPVADKLLLSTLVSGALL
ncbi:MAG: CDP-alcohol phosphatidyltransferase family protein [Terracidiphilus sp.]